MVFIGIACFIGVNITIFSKIYLRLAGIIFNLILYMNNAVWQKLISVIFRSFKSLKIGSVCAWYWDPEYIRIALFWSNSIELRLRLQLVPHTMLQYDSLNRISELYRSIRVFFERSCFILFNVQKLH